MLKSPFFNSFNKNVQNREAGVMRPPYPSSVFVFSI